MLGTVPTSVPQFILLGNWLLEGKFSEKWHKLKNNKLFWILSSVFIIHVLGLLYTTNIKAGWDDVRTKIPLMYLPLIYFSTNPLTKKEIHYLFCAFILGSFINITWCFVFKYMRHHTEQIRDVSRFMSHIRLGFLIDLAIVFCIYLFFEARRSIVKIGFSLLCLYFLYSLYALGLVSGIGNLAIISFAFIIVFLFKRNKMLLAGFISVSVFTIFYLVYNITTFYKNNFDVNTSNINTNHVQTKSGRFYNHYPFTNQVENGYLVAKNIQEHELQKEWNLKVPSDTINVSQKHNLTRYYTLVRYLTSKGVLKDSSSVSLLNSTELNHIQKGITNVNYPQWSFFNKRLYELTYDYFEFRNNGTINGHSFSMRLFYLKAAMYIIKNNFIFGVGTGDVQTEMNNAYELINSPLEKEWYKRPHNQFVTITVSTGIIGLLTFIISLLYPLISLHKNLSILYSLFIASAFISFLFEDTLETQIGLSYFAIFNTLFVSNAYFKKKQILQD